MNRNRLLFIGIIALGVAAIVSVGVYKVLRATVASARTANTTVVVAAIDLNVGTRLSEADLRLVKLPGTDLPAGAFHTTAELINRGVITPIAKNELILTSKIAGENGGSGLPSMIPAGMRAVSVKVNDVVAVAGFAVPGTRVDVLLTGNPTKDNDPGKTMTTTVLENVQVLAAGQKLQTNSQGEPQQVPVITLLVTPEQAQALTLATSEGRIQLSLRNPLDVDQGAPDTLMNASLYKILPVGPPPKAKNKTVAKKVAPLPPPASIYVVELIRGDKRETSKF